MVDLADCDREPIHVPGTVQDFGVLLVLTDALAIAQVSDNASAHLAASVQDMLGQPLSKFLDAASVDQVRNALPEQRWIDLNPLPILDVHGRTFDGIVHRYDGATILELEPRAAASRASTIPPFRSALVKIQHARTLAELAGIVVDHMQRLTGFERVMFYRFHADGSGSVDAEARAPHLEPYLGLRYPASDIPAQVRGLYLENPLRLIVDARRDPARMVPALRPDTGRPLDLRFAVLRGVSPIHREYMSNMGTRASMSIALVVRDRLWGLISCLHHTAPRHVAHDMRAVSEFVGRLVSLQIGAFDDRESLARRASRRTAESVLHAAMRDAPADAEPLVALLKRPRELLDLVGARGCAVVGAHEPRTCGETPSPELVRELATWLDTTAELRAFATAALGDDFPRARAASDVASGLLTFALPGTPPERLMWFRPEIVKTVNWGGDPTKPVDSQTGRLHPRNSFKLWRQEVRHQAAPWTSGDLEAADGLHRCATEVDLERRLRSEQQAVRVRDEVTAIVSHDLRAPLGVIVNQVELMQMQGRASGDDPQLERIRRAARSMTVLIEDLLDLSTIEAGRLGLTVRTVDSRELLEDALRAVQPAAEARRIGLARSWSELPRLDADPDRISQVLANLLGNAIKFTPAGGTVTLSAEVRPGELAITVADTGPGIPREHLDHVFDRYWQAAPSGRRGAGLGLYIARGIVEAHGGRIRAGSSERGARMTFTLPLTGRR